MYSALNLIDLLKYDENNLPSHAYPNLMITNHDLVRFGDLIHVLKEHIKNGERIPDVMVIISDKFGQAQEDHLLW